jgi:hypothetical protein
MTPEIERIQNEIGLNLINAVPVPWNKICYRAICNSYSSEIYYFFEEAQTGVVSSSNNAHLRFKKEWYKVDLNKTTTNLLNLPIQLYNEYSSLQSAGKMWDALTYILHRDGQFNIEFEYNREDTPLLNRKQWRLKYFGESSNAFYKGLYPDTTDVINK